MLEAKKPILSICLSCKDDLEETRKERGGKRFSELFMENIKQKKKFF